MRDKRLLPVIQYHVVGACAFLFVVHLALDAAGNFLRQAAIALADAGNAQFERRVDHERTVDRMFKAGFEEDGRFDGAQRGALPLCPCEEILFDYRVDDGVDGTQMFCIAENQFGEPFFV